MNQSSRIFCGDWGLNPRPCIYYALSYFNKSKNISKLS